MTLFGRDGCGDGDVLLSPSLPLFLSPSLSLLLLLLLSSFLLLLLLLLLLYLSPKTILVITFPKLLFLGG